MGGDARSLYEEGLAIPLMKLFKGGEANQELFDIIRANVRVPDQVIGDIYAQEVGNQVGARKLIEMLDEYDLPDIEEISAQILDRTEAAVRAAIREIARWRLPQHHHHRRLRRAADYRLRDCGRWR